MISVEEIRWNPMLDKRADANSGVILGAQMSRFTFVNDWFRVLQVLSRMHETHP